MTQAFDQTRQARWEAETFRRASEAYREALKGRLRKDGTRAPPPTLDELPPGRKLLREIIPSLTKRIEARQEEGLTLVRSLKGSLPKWAVPVQLLKAEEMAVITLTIALRTVADSDGSDAEAGGFTLLTRRLAKAIRDQVEFERWSKEAGRDLAKAFEVRYPNADTRSWARWRKRVNAVREEPWGEEIEIVVGTLLIHELAEAAPTRFEIAMAQSKGAKTKRVLKLAPETLALIDDIHTRAEVARPTRMPMLIQPLPWTRCP